MGVQHLWSILEPSKTEENIANLRDKTLCIDLSLWICEAQGTKGLKDQLKPYLRNVFFRTLYLASLGVRPVFVVDGVPPEIKRETIVKRLQARGEHVSNNPQKKHRKLNRSKFTLQCNECCEMLRLLGIPFVKSDGEAEAMCAWLNENNYADGVLTDDGDVFLYGAKVVYKDFNISSSKHPTDNLQVFRLEEVESVLGLTRRNMIALALLLGCDYLPAGVPGVGKETAMKLFTSLPGVDLLNRFSEWKSCPDVHPHEITSLEMAIKRKAVKVHNFPNKAVLKEFLSPNVGNTNVNLKWKCPDLEGIKEFFLRKLDWPKEYTEEKMLILVTDWQLAHMNLTRAPLFFPARIIKPRVKQGKEYYEIEWNTEDETSKLWPKAFVSVKPKDMICRKYPLLAERFEVELASKRSKGKTKKGKKTKTAADELECLDDLLCKINNIDLNENTKIMAEHSNNDCNDKDISRKTSQKVTLAAGPYFEPHQHSWSYDLEDNSLAGPMTNYTRTSESRKFYADDKIENVDSKEAESRADFVCIKPDQLLGTNRCENASPIIVNSSYTLPNLNFGAVGSSSSPAENEKTILNLADITVDQSFGSDFEAIDDLLTDSFVASLQNITPVHGSSCHYSTEISPSFKLFSTNTNHGNSDVLFETTMMNQSENVLLTSFGDKKFIDSPQELDMNPTGVKRQEFSTAIDGLDDENSICEPKAKFSVAASDTPSCRETTSLTSRLLKRFQTENRTNMADKLRSISGDKELVYSDKEINKSTEPPTYRAKQNKRFVTEVHDMNGPLTNISNIGKEMKSSKAKPKDVIVLD